MQDITSEVPPLQPGCNEEVIINCRQQQKQLQLPLQQGPQPPNQPPPPTYQRPVATNSTSTTNNNNSTARPQQQNSSCSAYPLRNGSTTPTTNTTNCKCDSQKLITRSQSTKVIQDLQPHPLHQLKQQQSLPTPLHGHVGGSPNGHPHHHHHHHHHNNHSKSVSILVYKTLNTVFKSSRKIIVRVCEVASVKKNFNMFKFNKASQQSRAEARASTCTGHDQFVRPPVSEKKAKHLMKKLNKQNGLKRSNSAIEFDISAMTAANRRHIYSSNRSASSEQDNSDHSEHSEKSPLVSARLDSLARIFFSKSMPAETGSRDTLDSVLTTRPNIKYQYSALDSGNGIVERSPRERAQREKALNATQEWIQNSNGRYEVIAHLDEIGSRHGKNWFLVTDSSVRTDRLMTMLTLPPDCVAFEDLSPNDSPKNILMELLGSLHHPYIYPVLDLGFLHISSGNFACLVTPFNSRGSLKDLIYKAQWNEPWSRKYTRKPNGLPVTQVQRLGRQILEALLFLKERGFPLHGHLHSGNVILQNGAARLSGLENGLLGLSSRINAVMWSRSTTDIENVDIICFGHLLYEMCMGQEMTTPKPSMRVLEMEMEHLPQILDVLGLIFEPPNGVCPSVEDLVLCDLFRSIDLRELRGPCFNTIKPSLSRSTLNLLAAVKKRQCASLGNSFSEASSPCTPPSTPRDRRSGLSRTMESFDCISSDSEEGLLDEIIVGCNFQTKHMMQRLKQQQHQHQMLQQQYKHQQQHSASQPTLAIGYYHSQPYLCHKSPYDPMESPIHYCDNTTQLDDYSTPESGGQGSRADKENQQQQQQQQPKHNRSDSHQQHPIMIRCSSTTESELNLKMAGQMVGSATANRGSICSSESTTSVTGTTIMSHEDQSDQSSITTQLEVSDYESTYNLKENLSLNNLATSQSQHSAASSHNGSAAMASGSAPSSASSVAAAGPSFNHQLTADMCNFKNSKSRRLEYSLKCLKYGRSNPSQDSAFGSLTDNDLSSGSSFRLSSFQSISSPIDEGVEDVIIATTTAGHETCLELATIPRNMVSQDSAISSPCRESSPSNFLNIEEGSCSGASSSSGSTGNLRPQHFPVSLSPKILVTATTNSSNSSLASAPGSQLAQQQQNQTQQFDPPKILVNDQNSIYTTSPSKKSGTIEVFSQKYRVSSFEDMSPLKRSSGGDKQHLKNVNRLAFRSLEEERRIDNAFIPITDRVHSDNRVNVHSEKYKKLTHASFRISKTSSQVIMYDTSPGQMITSSPGSSTMLAQCGQSLELQRPATAAGSSSSRQTMWRDSKFYRKNRIAKSNDSLLETSPNHSARLSPSSLRDNHYDSSSSYGSRSHSRQSLNRGGSINEIMGSNQTLGPEITVTTSFCNNPTSSHNSRRYCSSKSEDLGDSNDYLRAMDARKSYSERHLVTFETTLKQTAINNTMPLDGSDPYYQSEEDLSFKEDNNSYSTTAGSGGKYQNQNIPPPSSSTGQQRSQSHSRHYQQMQGKSHAAQKYNYDYYHGSKQSLQQQQSQHHQQQSSAMTSSKSSNFAKRSHPNQLSWSSCSINRLKTTNIKTTSLATLPNCQQQQTAKSATAYNLSPQHHGPQSHAQFTSYHHHHQPHRSPSPKITSSSTSPTPSTSSNNTNSNHLDTTRSPKKSTSRNPVVFKSLNNSTSSCSAATAGNTDTSSDNGSHNLSFGLDTSSSSPDESPTRRSISGIELAKIFSMDTKTGSNGCSEEKTPLLDSVEMSPISPTGPDDDDDGDADDDDEREEATNIDGNNKQKSDKM
uniref:Protein kinase domain-containing protein n=2 Tax=Stomoxys calcitrans TaxID=35570 RepID=A0A1I8PFR1_STOCA